MVKELAPQSAEGEYLRPKSQLRAQALDGQRRIWLEFSFKMVAWEQVDFLMEKEEKKNVKIMQ